MTSKRTILTLHKAERRIEIDLGDDADQTANLVDMAMEILRGERDSLIDPERIVALQEKL